MIVYGWLHRHTKYGATNISEADKKLAIDAIDQSDICVFATRKEEMDIWKHLLPAAVETCRRHWKHKSSCEYLIQGKIPLSTEP